jgi:predicted MFS family arabinose efflux permease
LLGIGVAGLVGTTIIGAILKRGLYPVLIGISVLMAILALLLIPLGGWLWPVAGLLALWGLVATAAPVGWWSWIAQVLPAEAEAGGGLMVAVIQLAIAFGSIVGGVLFDHHGYPSTFMASAAVLLVGAYLTARTARLSPEPRP